MSGRAGAGFEPVGDGGRARGRDSAGGARGFGRARDAGAAPGHARLARHRGSSDTVGFELANPATRAAAARTADHAGKRFPTGRSGAPTGPRAIAGPGVHGTGDRGLARARASGPVFDRARTVGCRGDRTQCHPGGLGGSRPTAVYPGGSILVAGAAEPAGDRTRGAAPRPTRRTVAGRAPGQGRDGSGGVDRCRSGCAYAPGAGPGRGAESRRLVACAHVRAGAAVARPAARDAVDPGGRGAPDGRSHGGLRAAGTRSV
jgi:hypothetical protein